MKKQDCWHYYMVYDGKLIGEADLHDLAMNTGIGNVEPLYKVVDRRRSLAYHFKHCPECGIKLNWKKFQKMAYVEWDTSVGDINE